MKTVVLTLSGGLDSSTLAYFYRNAGYNVHALSFDYGQRHKKELTYAGIIAKKVGAFHHVIDLTTITLGLRSALTDLTRVIPEGHYEDANMESTVVPNRNAIMLSIAFAIGSSMGADVVATGVHAGDHAVYADCRPEFIDTFELMESQSLRGLHKPHLETPFLLWTKGQIAAAAGELRVPVELTWSCYKGGIFHCSKCGTCIERREALYLAGVSDPTIYEDDEYWRTIISNIDAGRVRND